MDQVDPPSMSRKKQLVGVGSNGQRSPLTCVTDAPGRYQLPTNCSGTGPPDGRDAVGVGLGTADSGSVGEGVDWPHDEARKTNAMPSRAAARPLRMVCDWIERLAAYHIRHLLPVMT